MLPYSHLSDVQDGSSVRLPGRVPYGQTKRKRSEKGENDNGVPSDSQRLPASLRRNNLFHYGVEKQNRSEISRRNGNGDVNDESVHDIKRSEGTCVENIGSVSVHDVKTGFDSRDGDNVSDGERIKSKLSSQSNYDQFKTIVEYGSNPIGCTRIPGDKSNKGGREENKERVATFDFDLMKEMLKVHPNDPNDLQIFTSLVYDAMEEKYEADRKRGQFDNTFLWRMMVDIIDSLRSTPFSFYLHGEEAFDKWEQDRVIFVNYAWGSPPIQFKSEKMKKYYQSVLLQFRWILNTHLLSFSVGKFASGGSKPLTIVFSKAIIEGSGHHSFFK